MECYSLHQLHQFLICFNKTNNVIFIIIYVIKIPEILYNINIISIGRGTVGRSQRTLTYIKFYIFICCSICSNVCSSAMKYISTLQSIITLGSSYIFRNNYNTYLQFHIVYCRDVIQHKVQFTTNIVLPNCI